jgi:hypothetical protein
VVEATEKTVERFPRYFLRTNPHWSTRTVYLAGRAVGFGLANRQFAGCGMLGLAALTGA